ncbi:hypothetical protein AX16_007759 [Volvariella volvacea WC 439]|nr:hypothetical protein AX16_007759 [Volvariella volvacea WC 439]
MSNFRIAIPRLVSQLHSFVTQYNKGVEWHACSGDENILNPRKDIDGLRFVGEKSDLIGYLWTILEEHFNFRNPSFRPVNFVIITDGEFDKNHWKELEECVSRAAQWAAVQKRSGLRPVGFQFVHLGPSKEIKKQFKKLDHMFEGLGATVGLYSSTLFSS